MARESGEGSICGTVWIVASGYFTALTLQSLWFYTDVWLAILHRSPLNGLHLASVKLKLNWIQIESFDESNEFNGSLLRIPEESSKAHKSSPVKWHLFLKQELWIGIFDAVDPQMS